MENRKHEQSSDSRYLEKLKFSPELRKTWLNFFVTNFRVVLLLIVLISVWGLYSFFSLDRESNPEVKIPIAVVNTVYQGASPSDVEEFVTKKIETHLSGLPNLDKITSNSYNSFSSIVVQFDASADVDSSVRLLRDKVTEAKTDISSEADDPVVNQISLDDSPIWTISLTGPYDGFTLRKYAEDIQTELEKIPGAREINISGGDIHEFEVAYKADRLSFYGISPLLADQALSAAHAPIPSGNFEMGILTIPVRSDLPMVTVKDIENIPVSHTADGSVVFLKDIATISDKAEEHTSFARLSADGSQKPQDSVSISLVKRQGVSVIDTVDLAKKTVDDTLKNMPSGISYVVAVDSAKAIRDDFRQLTHDFLLTIILVGVILFLIVGIKEAFVAGLAIPLVFFFTFGALLQFGYTLNFLSLFSLILALSLLVDDAIVVVSATKQYMNTGKFTPEEAVLLVLNDFKWVLTTTTLATVWAFLPLIFATGIVGQYIKFIPVTVSTTLIASLFIALMINHPLAAVLERIRLTKKLFFVLEAFLVVMIGVLIYTGGIFAISLAVLVLFILGYMAYWYEKKGKAVLEGNGQLMDQEWSNDDLIKEKLKSQATGEHQSLSSKWMHGIINFHRFLPIYEKALRHYIVDKKMRKYVLIGVSILFLASVSLVPLGLVRSVFFPVQDTNYVFLDLRAPVGTNLTEMDRLTNSVMEKIIGKYPAVESISITTGKASSKTSSLSGVKPGAPNISSITLTLKDKDQRSVTSYGLVDQIRRDLGPTPGVITDVSTLAGGGPPSGSAFEAHISGDDLNKLNEIAKGLKPMLSSIPGAVNIDVSQKESVPEYTFTLDPIKLAQNNITASEVGATLRMSISGLDLFKIIIGEKEYQVVATFDQNSIPDLTSIQNIQITNQKGQPIFLKDVASIELKPAVDVITRIDQKRTIILTADADATTNGTALLSAFQKKISSYQMPSGYTITYGGENEQNAESVKSIMKAMLMALVLIVATLIIQFNSFRRALIVLVPIPLALIGVFVGMAVFNIPLSFPGLIGVLALFGIVVKNSIILVDKINLNIKNGIPLEDAVVDAGKARLEAIFITSICTIFGMLPITLSNEAWQSLGGAVIFGLTLSSFLTLFIVPAFYLILIKEDKLAVETKNS